MARASKKVKRPAEEFPPLRMVIEKGHLVPAFPLDFERLDSFRNGTQMLVWMASDGDRPLVRKWWAILGWYLKNTTLPWGDKETASAAIKLALAMIEPFKMPSGQWSQYPRSLTDIDDAELEDKIREMQQLLYELTGVDQEAMRREGGSEGDEHFETTPPAADNDAGSATSVASPSDVATSLPDDTSQAPSGEVLADSTPISEASSSAGNPAPDTHATGAAATHSHSEGELDAGNPAGAPSDSGSAEPDLGAAATTSPAAALSVEDRQWLSDGARMMLGAQPEPSAEAKDVLFRQVKGIITLMPKTASADARSRMEAVKQHCMAVCRGDVELDVPLVARTALSTVAEIMPPPVKTARAST